MPLEFIPPTVVLIIAAVVWLLARLNRQLNAPAEAVDFFALSPEEVDAEFWVIADGFGPTPEIPRPRPSSDDPFDVETEGL